MFRFLARRLLYGIVVLWVISIAVFVLFFVAPNNPAKLIAGRLADARTVALVRHRLGLDQSVLSQYGGFVWKLLHGNLGYSFYSSESVNSIIAQRFPVTLSLVLGAAVIWFVSGVAIGTYSSTHPRSLIDRGSTAFVLAGISMPTFLLGELLIFFAFFKLHQAGVGVFPAGDYVGITDDPLAWLQHLVLPWITLALVLSATYARLARSSMLETLGEDYIRTAHAKGLRPGRVVYRHGLRSAMTPLVTQFGIDIGTALGGVIVTETVFGLPGLGQIAVESVTNQDLPVIIAVVMLASTFIVVTNICVDLMYAVLDPRVRLS